MTYLEILRKELPFYFIKTDNNIEETNKNTAAFNSYSHRHIFTTFQDIVTWERFATNLVGEICMTSGLHSLYYETSYIPDATKEAMDVFKDLFSKTKSRDDENFYYVKVNKSQDWETLLQEGKKRIRLYFIDDFLNNAN